MTILDLLDIIAILGLERWQSIKNCLHLGSVKYRLGIIGGVKAIIIEVMLGGISPSSFEVTSMSLAARNVWVEVIDSSYRKGGWHAEEMSEPA